MAVTKEKKQRGFWAFVIYLGQPACGSVCARVYTLAPVITHQLSSSWSLKVTRQMYIQHRESRETSTTSAHQQPAHCGGKTPFFFFFFKRVALQAFMTLR